MDDHHFTHNLNPPYGVATWKCMFKTIIYTP